MLAEIIERVEDLPVYQTFRGLADEVERVSREYGTSYRWLRNQTVKSAESACAHLTDQPYVEYTSACLKSLYRCRSEVRGVLSHLQGAREAGLSGTVVEGLSSRYEKALEELAKLIERVEKALELRTQSVRSLSARKEEHKESLALSQVSWALPAQA